MLGSIKDSTAVYVVRLLWKTFGRTASAVSLVPVAAAFGVAFSLAFIGQFYELYLSLIEGLLGAGPDAHRGWQHLVFATGAMVLLSAVIHLSNRALSRATVVQVFRDMHADIVDPVLDRAVQAVGLFAAGLPWIGLIAGVRTAVAHASSHLDSLAGAATHFAKPLDITPVSRPVLDDIHRGLEPIGAVLAYVPSFGLLVLAWLTIVLGLVLRYEFGLVSAQFFVRALPAERLRGARFRLAKRRKRAAGDRLLRWRMERLPRIKSAAAEVIVGCVVLLVLGSLYAYAVKRDVAALFANLPFRPHWREIWPEAAITIWILGVLGLLGSVLVVRAVGRGQWARQSLARRRFTRVASSLLILGLVASVLSGFVEFYWVDIARTFGPLAMSIILSLVVLAMFLAQALFARETGAPLFVVVAAVVALVVGVKLQWSPGWLSAAVALLLVGALGLRLYGLRTSSALALGTGAAVALGLYLGLNAADETAQAASTSQRRQSISKLAAARPDLVQKLDAWLKAREPQRAEYTRRNPGRGYPVFIVAAEGGGIYAAAAASAFLARLQERCPSFAQHVFAVSGVSGGAVGSLIFHGALQAADKGLVEEVCRALPEAAATTDLQRSVADVVKDDHLSPLVGLVVPDLLGTLGDRAAGLSKSLQLSMRRHYCEKAPKLPCDAKLWNKAYALHWRADRPLPALILNTTLVHAGARAVFTPFTLDPKNFITMSLGQLTRDTGWNEAAYEQISLTDAAVISARFPGVLKAFEIRARSEAVGSQRVGWSFVDGGYVDSSGALTAQDIFQALKEGLGDRLGRDVDLRLVLLSSTISSKWLEGARTPSLRDLAAPVVALFEVRNTLSTIAVTETITRVEPGSARKLTALEHVSQRGDPNGWSITTIELDQEDFKLELGWKISAVTYDIVSMLLGQADLCPHADADANKGRTLRAGAAGLLPQMPRASSTAAARVIRANSCVMASIEQLLDGRRKAQLGIR